MDFAVRAYNATTDDGFVRRAWFRGPRFGASKRIPLASWAKMQGAHVDRCLATGVTIVAADLEDPRTLLGWVCGAREAVPGGLVVHWAYVPRLLRQSGLGGALVSHLGAALGISQVLRVVATQASKHDGWIADVAGARGVELVFDPTASMVTGAAA